MYIKGTINECKTYVLIACEITLNYSFFFTKLLCSLTICAKLFASKILLNQNLTQRRNTILKNKRKF